jgi:hypothetical protein
MRLSTQAEISCGSCELWSAHLYELQLGADKQGMTLCNAFCQKYVAACGAALALPADYCTVYSPEVRTFPVVYSYCLTRNVLFTVA